VIVALGFIGSRLSQRARRQIDGELAEKDSSIVTFDDNSIVFRSLSSTVTLEWAHFTEFIETDRLLILRCGTLAGHAIAKRSFESRQATGAYADALEQHLGVRSDSDRRAKQTGRRRSRQFRRLNIVVYILGSLVVAGFVALFLAEALR
jgi:hypothetical protein